MTRDTKIGLLVGLAFIILFGIILSEKSTSKQQINTPQIAAYKPMVEVLPADRSSNRNSGPQFTVAQLRQRTDKSPGNNTARAGDLTVAPVPTATNTTAEPTAATPQRQMPPPNIQPANPDFSTPPLRRMLPHSRSGGVAQAPESLQQLARATAESESNTGNAGPVMEYTVASGDTLVGICKRFYGSSGPGMVKLIMDLNGTTIPKPEKLRAEQVIKIPAPKQPIRLVVVEDHPTAAIARQSKKGFKVISVPSNQTVLADADNRLARGDPKKTTKSTEPTRWYTVQSNDTLMGIAERTLGSSQAWKKLYSLNQDKISDPDMVKQGVKIRIPKDAALASSSGVSP